MVEIVPARLVHVGPIASRIRDIDRLECEVFGHSAKQALRNGVYYSDQAWTALVNGRPEAMFGCVTASAISGMGTPWFLGTDEVYRHGKALVMFGPYFVRAIVDSTPNLSNLVSSANDKAIRLLKLWGFTVGEEILVGDVPFRHFSMRA